MPQGTVLYFWGCGAYGQNHLKCVKPGLWLWFFSVFAKEQKKYFELIFFYKNNKIKQCFTSDSNVLLIGIFV